MTPSPLRTFEARFFAPAPPERVAALRVLVGMFGTVYVLARVPYVLDVARLPDSRFEPVGVLRWLDDPLPLWSVRVLLAATVALGVAFTVGWRHRVVAPMYAVTLLVVMTYTNSWQHIAHTENLLVLHTAVLAIAPAAVVWSLDARRGGTPAPAPSSDHGWPVRLMTVLTATTYVLAGIAKVRHGGVDWVSGDVLRNLVAHDNLRKIVLGDWHSPIGGWLVAHRWAFPPLAVVSLAVELGAVVALLGGRIRYVWVAAAWLFHVGVLALMAIVFIYPLTGIAFASMLRPEVVFERIRAWRRRPASSEPALAAYRRGDAG
jgi:hypothetical protein